MFNFFKVTPARKLIKENPFAVSLPTPDVKERKPQAPPQAQEFWEDEQARRTRYFKASGDVATVLDRDPALNSADVDELRAVGLWPKNRDKQAKFHRAKKAWSEGDSIREIAQVAGTSESMAEKCSAAFGRAAKE